VSGKRPALPSTAYSAALVILLIVAASGYGLLFTGFAGEKTMTSVSLVTVTTFQTQVLNHTLTLVKSGTNISTLLSSVTTVTKTVAATGTNFNGTLVIIPSGVASNPSLDFTPPDIHVIIGVNNTITWLNQDKTSQHTVVSQSSPAGARPFSIIIAYGQIYTLTLTVPGTYKYYCMWHPTWMKGTIIVSSG
jgi:plastocyanin